MAAGYLGKLPEQSAAAAGGGWVLLERESSHRKNRNLPFAVPVKSSLLSALDPEYRPPSGVLDHCIYCGALNSLSDEHSIPFALNGKWVLPKATCTPCARNTSRMERICARNVLGSMRIQHGFRTRRKRRKPDPVKLIVSTDILTGAAEKTLALDPVRAPLVPIGIPALDLPGDVTGRYAIDGFRNATWLWTPPARGLEAAKVRRIKPDGVIGFEFKQDHFAMSRLMAKIAFCEAVARFGTDQVTRELVPYIMGLNPHLTDKVGQMPNPFDCVGSVSDPACRVSFLIWEQLGLATLVAKVELFNHLGGPSYLVAVCKASGLLKERVLLPKIDG